MSGIGRFKLSDALRPTVQSPALRRGGKPASSSATTAEQTRESHERDEALQARAATRDRMVDIGRGNQQAGRQGQ